MLILVILVRLLAYATLTYGVLRLYRSASHRSSLLGGIFAVGVSLRVVLGTLLFLISYFRWPLFESVQMGGGFWTLALDGRWYFDAASQAIVAGISSVPDGSASPFYVQVLAIWMTLFGVNPLSAVTFNLECYVGCAALIVLVATHTRAATVGLAALTFSPALVIFGTQPLKDTLCALLITMALAGMSLWVRGLEPRRLGWRHLAHGVALLAAAVYGIAGIRAYLAVFVLAAYSAVILWSAYRVVTRRDRWSLIGAQLSLGLILWVAFASGAGSYYASYRDRIFNVISAPLQPFMELETARAGFARTQGATSIVASPSPKVGAPASEALNSSDSLARDSGGGFIGTMRNLMLGSALLFVPVSILKALSIVTFPGGRGLLYVTDIDTMIMNAGIAASIFLLASVHPGRRSPTVLSFGFVLAAITAIALAYVVTNFGTLFRLRLIVAVPLWLLPVFVTLGAEHDGRPQTS